MNYVYRFRLYPTKEQKQFLKQEAGNIRFVYNYFLSLAKKEYEINLKKWNFYEYKKLLPKLKKEFEFLKLSNSQSLQESLKNLDKAFKSFFKGLSDFPKFKKKKKINSISIPQHFKIEENKLKIPKLKTPIKFKKHREIEGEIKSISITITPSGKYYLNVLTNRDIKPLPKAKKVVAIDIGLKDFIVTSDNQAIKNPKHFYEKITNAKNDFLHKLSRKIIDENQVIIIENLNIYA